MAYDHTNKTFLSRQNVNPRREGTHGHKVYALILQYGPISYFDLKQRCREKELELGIPTGRLSGLSNHLTWDCNRDRLIVTLRDVPGDFVPDETISSHLKEDMRLEGTRRTVTRLEFLRSALVRQDFLKYRERDGRLRCDDCGFDPVRRKDLTDIEGVKSLFDVHHINPLANGPRMTGRTGLSLLCPLCHRVEHVRIKLASMA